MFSYSHYHPGHPWYYLLGGPRLRLKQIKANVSREYDGYLAYDIYSATNLPEPTRS